MKRGQHAYNVSEPIKTVLIIEIVSISSSVMKTKGDYENPAPQMHHLQRARENIIEINHLVLHRPLLPFLPFPAKKRRQFWESR